MRIDRILEHPPCPARAQDRRPPHEFSRLHSLRSCRPWALSQQRNSFQRDVRFQKRGGAAVPLRAHRIHCRGIGCARSVRSRRPARKFAGGASPAICARRCGGFSARPTAWPAGAPCGARGPFPIGMWVFSRRRRRGRPLPDARWDRARSAPDIAGGTPSHQPTDGGGRRTCSVARTRE